MNKSVLILSAFENRLIKSGHSQTHHANKHYYYRKKRFRWRNVKRLQGHLTNAKGSDKTRVRRKVRTEYLSDAVVDGAVEIRKTSDEQFVFNWRLKDASEDNDVRDLDKLFHVRAAAMGKAWSPAGERASTLTRNAGVDEPPGLTHVVGRGISTTEPGRSGSRRRVLRAWTRSAAQFSASAAPEEVVWRGRTCSALLQLPQLIATQRRV